MKSLWGSLLLVLLFSTSAYSIEIKDVDMFGYARAGVGTNTYGGDQECFYNQGAGGWGGVGRNEFRLGNECSNYLEIALKFNHVKTETKKVFTQFRIANSDTRRDAAASTYFAEAFAEMQGVTELPWTFWVGKKFYRDQDIYMDDNYYFGSMSGNGGGIGNIDLLGAKLSLAYLRQVKDTRTSVGLYGATIYDVRLKELRLTNSLKEHFWFAYGQTPESTNTTTQAKYFKANGYVFGTLFDYDLNGKGFNHFAILFGQGLMNNFNLYGLGDIVDYGNQSSGKKRLRFVNHTTMDINEKWAFHLSLNHERIILHGDIPQQWMSAGVRPIYRVTQNFHLVTEAGHSIYRNNGSHKLTRLTLAPQLSINENIWGRPVLRAFYTHSFWNGTNMSNVAQNAPTYSNKTDGGAYGLQIESFF